MGEVVLYKCVVCGEAYTKVQSLRAHLKRHRDVRWTNFTVRIPWALAERFKAACKKHNTTTCLLISTVMQAVLKGEEVGVIDLAKLAGPNPFVITMHEYFLGSPRSPYRVPVPERSLALVGPGRCPECGSSDVLEHSPFRDGFREGRCRKCGADYAVRGRPRKVT